MPEEIVSIVVDLDPQIVPLVVEVVEKGDPGPQGDQGPQGTNGYDGQDGAGVASGGVAGQFLTKNSSSDFDTSWTSAVAAQTVVIPVKGSSVTTYKGTAVYISGSDGTLATIGNSRGGLSNADQTIGLATTNIAANAQGLVITKGLLGGLNTSGATAAGVSVWLSVDTAGAFVYGDADRPVAPDHAVYLGVVTKKSATAGEILVDVKTGFELKGLHDVSSSPPSYLDVLSHNGSIWTPETAFQDSFPAGTLVRRDASGFGVFAGVTIGDNNATGQRLIPSYSYNTTESMLPDSTGQLTSASACYQAPIHASVTLTGTLYLSDGTLIPTPAVLPLVANPIDGNFFAAQINNIYISLTRYFSDNSWVLDAYQQYGGLLQAWNYDLGDYAGVYQQAAVYNSETGTYVAGSGVPTITPNSGYPAESSAGSLLLNGTDPKLSYLCVSADSNFQMGYWRRILTTDKNNTSTPAFLEGGNTFGGLQTFTGSVNFYGAMYSSGQFETNGAQAATTAYSVMNRTLSDARYKTYYAYAYSDVSCSSNTTFVTGAYIASIPAGNYQLETYEMMTAGSTASGVQSKVITTTGAISSAVGTLDVKTNAATNLSTLTCTAETGLIGVRANTGGSMVLSRKGYCVISVGSTLALQVAQNLTAAGTPMKLLSGSFIKLTRLL